MKEKLKKNFFFILLELSEYIRKKLFENKVSSVDRFVDIAV